MIQFHIILPIGAIIIASVAIVCVFWWFKHATVESVKVALSDKGNGQINIKPGGLMGEVIWASIGLVLLSFLISWGVYKTSLDHQMSIIDPKPPSLEMLKNNDGSITIKTEQ